MTGGAVTTPTTQLQEAAWWVGLRAKDGSVHHITWRLTCATPVDHGALGVAWQAVVDRHEALRLSMAKEGGALTTTIHPRVEARVQLVEVADPGSVPADALLRTIAEELHLGDFRLDRAPLARLAVVRVRDSCELVLTAHHIAIDGWAVQLLLADLSDAYRAAVGGERPAFTTEPASWHEYARGQEEARASDVWRSSTGYWADRLDGAVATTIEGDRDRHATTGAPGAVVRYAFGAEAVEGLAALAKATSTTSFAVVLAAAQILLARAGGGSDVVIGVVTANRMTAREQRLVGYLANVCLIRGTISERDTLADVAGRARGALWEMFAHQSVPYPAVISSLPEPTRTVLGDTVPLMLNYLGPIGGGLELGGIGLTMRESPNQAARTDIAVAYWDDESGGVTAEVEYSTVRYDRDTVLRLLGDLDAILAAGVEGSREVGRITVRSRSSSAPPGPLPDTTGSPRPAGAGNPARDVVWQVWADVLGYPPKSPDEDFFAGGGHSLNAVEFVAALAEATGSELALETWLADPTPRAVLDQLGDGAAGRSGTVVSLRAGDGPHLHLFPGAAGTAQDYRELIGALPENWRITLSQEREPLAGVAAAAARFRADLDAEGLRPDLVAGWSMGGQVAFEFASGCGDAPPGLVLIDAPPPVGADLAEEPVWHRLGDFAATVCLTLGVRLDGSPLTLPGDPDGDDAADDAVRVTLVELAARLRAAGLDVKTRALAHRWSAYHRHVSAVAAFVSDAVLAVPCVMIVADLPGDGVAAWADRFAVAPEVLRLEADHYSVLRAPAVGVVASALERVAAPADASTPG